MKWSIDQNDYYRLYCAVDSALAAALANPVDREPQLVANLVRHLCNEINHLSPLNGVSIRSGGVFVHGQPLVKCVEFQTRSPHAVEIGDLLLLRAEVANGNVINRKALLLQAKKVSSCPARADNENQHLLYAYWPRFEYVRSTASLNGKKRHNTGPNLYDGAKYLLINNNGMNVNVPICRCVHLNRASSLSFNHIYTAHPSPLELSHHRCFICEMVDFILGDIGKAYSVPPPLRTRSWDRIIKDLTDVTARLTSEFMRAASGNESSYRGADLLYLTGKFEDQSLLFKARQLKNLHGHYGNDKPPDAPGEWRTGKTIEGAISVVEIISQSQKA